MSNSLKAQDVRQSDSDEMADPLSESDEEWAQMTEEEREERRQQWRNNKRKERENDKNNMKIATDPNLSFPEKVDKLYGGGLSPINFEPSVAIIESCVTGSISVETAAQELAAPIDHLWSTANEGREYYNAEKAARYQRPHRTLEEALEIWGPEQDWPEPPGPYDPNYSTEGRLWDLWYAFLHVARRTEWDHVGQMKLVELMRALRNRPDPPLPDPMTKPLKRSWIWEEGSLWPIMLVLDIALMESFDIEPGRKTGRSNTAMRAYANMNAFLAKTTVAIIYDFRQYGFRVLSDLLERELDELLTDHHAYLTTEINDHTRTALIWIQIAAQFLWDRREDDRPEYQTVSLTTSRDDLPWLGNDGFYRLSDARLNFWLGRLEEINKDERVSETAKETCREITRLLREVSQTTNERIKDRVLVSGWVAMCGNEGPAVQNDK